MQFVPQSINIILFCLSAANTVTVIQHMLWEICCAYYFWYQFNAFKIWLSLQRFELYVTLLLFYIFDERGKYLELFNWRNTEQFQGLFRPATCQCRQVVFERLLVGTLILSGKPWQVKLCSLKQSLETFSIPLAAVSLGTNTMGQIRAPWHCWLEHL